MKVEEEGFFEKRAETLLKTIANLSKEETIFMIANNMYLLYYRGFGEACTNKIKRENYLHIINDYNED